MKLVCFRSLAFLALVGCSRQSPTQNTGALPTASVEVGQTAAADVTQASPPASAHPVPEAAIPTISDAERPKTIDEFKSQFLRYHKKDMYAPFIELAYWGSSTDEQKKDFLTRVRSMFMSLSNSQPAAVNSPDDIEVFTISQYTEDTGGGGGALTAGGAEVIALSPEPTHVLQITCHSEPANGSPIAEEDEGITASEDFAVGVHDGRYYFCTVKPK